MISGARATLAASLVLVSSCAFAAPVFAHAGDVAVLRPGEGDDVRPWDGARMRGARERLKEMLPGRPD